ncbi:MAG TPA: hypothetical protein VNK26_00445 [Pyrinomonadaceae bacterium]|nr:hypothetical protein [Pyrinomonadaceae bacterium]
MSRYDYSELILIILMMIIILIVAFTAVFLFIRQYRKEKGNLPNKIVEKAEKREMSQTENHPE